MAGRPKKKPEYNPELQFNNFLQELKDAYTSIFRSIVYWLVTTLCAAIITWIIKKLPSGKCLIKI